MPTLAIIGKRLDALILTPLNGTFESSDIPKGDKMIVLLDTCFTEIIFTNEVLSISCFSKCHPLSTKQQFKVHLAGISHQYFRDNKSYDVKRLGFYSERKSYRLSQLEPLIKPYMADFLIAKSPEFYIKEIPKFVLESIYNIFSEFLNEGMKKLATAVPLSISDFNDLEDISDEKINVYSFDQDEEIVVYEDYSFLNISSIQN